MAPRKHLSDIPGMPKMQIPKDRWIHVTVKIHGGWGSFYTFNYNVKWNERRRLFVASDRNSMFGESAIVDWTEPTNFNEISRI